VFRTAAHRYNYHNRRKREWMAVGKRSGGG
jgi:hypothetical protein